MNLTPTVTAPVYTYCRFTAQQNKKWEIKLYKGQKRDSTCSTIDQPFKQKS